MAKVGNPYHDPSTGEFTSGSGGTGTLRYSQMSKKGKARLSASSQVTAVISQGKVIRHDPRKIPTPFKPSTPSAHAVAIKTAHALDSDFRRNIDKVAHEQMKAAIEKHQGNITKLPSQKITHAARKSLRLKG